MNKPKKSSKNTEIHHRKKIIRKKKKHNETDLIRHHGEIRTTGDFLNELKIKMKILGKEKDKIKSIADNFTSKTLRENFN